MTADPLRQLPISAHDEFIIVIHGFAGKRLLMRPLCSRLRSQGCRVSNWGYSSLRGSLAEHAQRLYKYLAMTLSKERRVHIVAHSMGAIVARAALSIGPVVNLGRIELLAPPNHGTPVARHAARVVGRVWKGIVNLSDHPDSFVNRLPNHCPIDVGIVAARFDTLVPVGNTHLDGECQHVVLNATHNSLLLSRNVAHLVVAFIAGGAI